MIRNLLDANGIKAGEGFPLKASPCELNGIIRNALDNLITLYGNRFVFEEDSKVTVSLRVLKESSKVEIGVHNWGTPIAKEDVETLFQHFRRRDTSQSAGHRGWGIGLTLVRGIAEAYAQRLGAPPGPLTLSS